MPADQGVWFHDREHGSPVDQPGEQNQRDPGRIVGSMPSDSTLSVERQLLPQEEILRRQLRPGTDAQREEPDEVDQHTGGGPPGD
jgi:hypothetical protein